MTLFLVRWGVTPTNPRGYLSCLWAVDTRDAESKIAGYGYGARIEWN